MLTEKHKSSLIEFVSVNRMLSSCTGHRDAQVLKRVMRFKEAYFDMHRNIARFKMRTAAWKSLALIDMD
jgi:hypothetical protein